MSWMFYNCNALSSLPDLSKWNISNVTTISNMFSGYLKYKIKINFINY